MKRIAFRLYEQLLTKLFHICCFIYYVCQLVSLSNFVNISFSKHFFFLLAEMKKIRMNAIHIRGVEELTEDEVMYYFREFGPSEVEWINDASCKDFFIICIL